MLLDLWPFFYQYKFGGDDAGGWRRINEKKPVKKETVREALKKVIEAGEKVDVKTSITLEVQGKIVAPKVDWEELQRDLVKVEQLLALANRIVWQQQEEDDEEALMVLI